MMTRRKSSEQIIVDPPKQKKVKLNKGVEQIVAPIDELEQFITNVKTIEILKNRGISSLFEIQKSCYPIIYEGQDLIGQDRTGSGKTLAYILPVCERLREQGVYPKQNQVKIPKRELYTLIVVPTRELCMQVSKELNTLKHFENEFKIHTVYGGTQISEQIRELRLGGEWIVATPGRLLDMMNRGIIKFNTLRTVIIDEADQMLQFGFQEDIEKIFKQIAENTNMSEVQALMFSATIPQWMKKLSSSYMKADRKHINLINLSESQAASQVTHYALHCAFGMMIGTIGDVVSVYGGKHAKTIIFCETKAQANDIMIKANIPTEVQVLHGDIAQKQREITFNAFKSGQFKCLIATNVASRGLDFPEVDLIIQNQPPKEVDTYIHRAGRTARAGKKGVCITFYSKTQQFLIDRIERVARIKFIKMNPPQPVDIIKASQRDLHLSLKEVSDDIIHLFKPVAQEIAKDMDLVEALSRALAHMSGYKNSIKQRSMLGSFEGFITLIITTKTQFNSPSYFKTFLRSIVSEPIVNSIKGLRKLKYPELGIVFDLPIQYLKELQAAIDIYTETDKIKNFSLEIPTSLPEMEEDPYANNNNNNNSQGNYRQQQQYGRGAGSDRRSGSKPQKEFEIFVGGLGYDQTEASISNFFKNNQVGISSIRLLKDDQQNFKGIAFAQCQNNEEVQKALQLNGYEFNGRKLRINMADQKPR